MTSLGTTASGFNSAASVANNAMAQTDDPYRAFNFFIEIEGILAGGFSECSGLQVETEFFEYHEGGVNEFRHYFAGATKYAPLILKRGLTPIDELWTWHQDIVLSRRILQRNGTIYLLNEQRLPVVWWDFKAAFPYRWSGPDLQANGNAVAFESVELVHQGLSRPRTSGTANR